MQGKPASKQTTSLRLSGKQLEDIDRLVRRTGMRSRTEFVERAIDRYLDELTESKVLMLKEWTEPKARAAVLKYLKGRQKAYVSDIIEALGMEPDLAFRVVDTLLEEGAVDRTA